MSNKDYTKTPTLYKIGRSVLGPVFKNYYRPVIIGEENIPTEGRAIIAGDHIHLYDQCHALISTKRPIFYMAKKEYFDNKKTKWFFDAVGCIPVDRSKKDENATASALEVLNSDGLLGIFPEGTRNHAKDTKIKEIYDEYLMNMNFEEVRDSLRDKNVKLSQVNFLLKLFEDKRIDRKKLDKAILHVDSTLRNMMKEGKITEEEYYDTLLLPFKFGVVSLAKKTGSPIIPMVATGKYEHHSKDLIVQFGKPYFVGDKEYEVAIKELREEFIEMIKENEKILNDNKDNTEPKKTTKK